MKILHFLVLAVCISAASAQPASSSKRAVADDSKEIRLGEDEPGCKDSALLARLPACSIIQCDSKENATAELHIGASTEGVVQKEPMEGPTEVIYYLCPTKTSPGNIVKVLEPILTKSGFKTIYSGKDGEDMPLLTVMKETQWIQISTYMYNDNGAYIQTAIKVAPDAQANAEAMADEIVRTGRVTLTGLLFEKDKTELPLDADKLLAEVAAFLVRQPDLKVRVEVQTTDAGNAQQNEVMSRQRASAVASWLLEHGIDKTRVSIHGIGEPKLDPESPQRIDLVKM